MASDKRRVESGREAEVDDCEEGFVEDVVGIGADGDGARWEKRRV